ncbi:LmbE family N-acetylglucosaminyl deacetylase [Nocardia tenerifensis]|uniref:LmbE family N-acetylglucosaminyl deacetylase n=1 Tax=Nocardia tenerifensis TaxID=228006 RepID=A0A318K8R2_9NOCA|nr:PIG-L family deacetylase [Nocardia tenerifensis]PXX69104.1 LmbE family N-acetylglucosaminyl deacetylase [Nocardia tenerifensis]
MATVVAFHAHPDDETLLTGGTLAAVAAAGHRTVLVVATDGHMAALDGRKAVRLTELAASAAALGVDRVAHLGYADSGHGAVLYADPPDRVRFLRAEVAEAAERLAAILREERADVLLSYDRNGGYGHRDHVRVHEVGTRAAELAGVPRVLDATMPRDRAARIMRLLARMGFRRDDVDLRSLYSADAEITHRIDVRAFAAQRKAAVAAHRSTIEQAGSYAAIAKVILRLPAPILGRLMRWEWYVEEGAGPVARPLDDLFRSARD